MQKPSRFIYAQTWPYNFKTSLKFVEGKPEKERNWTWGDQRTWCSLVPMAIHYTQEKEEGPDEGVVAPVRGLLIHICSLLFTSCADSTQSNRARGRWDSPSLANNSPRNRNGFEVNWENKAPQKRVKELEGTFFRLMRPPVSMLRGTPSPQSPPVPSCPTRGGGRHCTQSKATHPWNVGGEHRNIPKRF